MFRRLTLRGKLVVIIMLTSVTSLLKSAVSSLKIVGLGRTNSSVVQFAEPNSTVCWPLKMPHFQWMINGIDFG